MLTEQQKRDVQGLIDLSLKAQTDELRKIFELITLPMTSQYMCLGFRGTADGTVLTPDFDVNMLIGKTLTIKRFAIYNYYPETGGDPSIDIRFSDGTFEEIPNGNYRINRLFDDFQNGTSIRLSINGNNIPIFPTVGLIGVGVYPADLDVDNIFYKYPGKITALTVQVWSTICDNLVTQQETNPFIKVVLECYLQ